MEENRYFILDAENGELVRGLGNDLSDVFNTTGEFRGTKIQGIKQFDKVDYKFIKVNYKALDLLMEIAPITVKLLKYINYNENALMFPNGVYINQTNLAKDLGVSREYICKRFKDLKEMKIINTIKKENKTIYLLNPYIATKRDNIYKEVFDKFNRTEWEKLSEKRGKRNEL